MVVVTLSGSGGTISTTNTGETEAEVQGAIQAAHLSADLYLRENPGSGPLTIEAAGFFDECPVCGKARSINTTITKE